MSGIGQYVLGGTGCFSVLISIAVVIGLTYLYVKARLRGTLWLLIWNSPVMALGGYLYLRSGWRWPKSLVVWVPFALFAVGCRYACPYMWARWLSHAAGQGNMILGLTVGSFIALAGYAGNLITNSLLLAAVIFLTHDLLRLIRERREPAEEVAVDSGGPA